MSTSMKPLCIHALAIGPCTRLGLGDLVLVVGKLQVLPPAVDVEAVAEQRVGHHRALDVPPRPPFAPGGGPPRPVGLVGLRRLPEREVGLVALALAGLAPALARALVDDVALGQLAVALELRGVVVHVAVVGDVREALRQQGLDVGDDAGDVLAHPRLGPRGAAHQGGHVVAVGRDEAVGDGLRRLAGVDRDLDDLVVDVGEVADVPDDEPLALEVAHQHVEDHRRPRVADVDVPVHRGAADVEGRLAGRALGQRDLRVGQAVVQAEGHDRWR
jgi:hypothetical protein